jgi:hypothetical protein
MTEVVDIGHRITWKTNNILFGTASAFMFSVKQDEGGRYGLRNVVQFAVTKAALLPLHFAAVLSPPSPLSPVKQATRRLSVAIIALLTFK